MHNFFKMLLIGMVLEVTGCATVTQGTQQAIAFKLEPNHTTCEISRVGDGVLGRVSHSANVIHVSKDRDDIVVVCNAKGYEKSTTRVVSGATGAGVTGVLLDFGITDMITGAMYRYPEDVTIALEKTASTASPVPMDRKTRSYFHPYAGENAEQLFLTRNMFFDGEDPKVNNDYYAKWLQEWFKHYDYCKNGHEIISNATERFSGSDVNANLGGNLVTHGRCKAGNL